MSSYAPPDIAANGGLSDKIAGSLGLGRRDSLPLYKDKPLASKGRATKRRKVLLVAVLGVFALLSWWYGLLSPLASLRSSDGAVVDIPPNGGKGVPKEGYVDWGLRAQEVRGAMKVTWDAYKKHAWGFDEFGPVTKWTKQMVEPSGLGWTIVDALDTLMIMNMSGEVADARQWIHNNLTYDLDAEVSTFETTIRMLGGLLSAHYLSTSFDGKFAAVYDDLSEDLYIEKAADLGGRLMGAYETKTGIPMPYVNLRTSQGADAQSGPGLASTAEVTSLQLEMKYLAKLTGEEAYWDTVEQVMKVIDSNRPVEGLPPIFLKPESGKASGSVIRLGSRGDSYFEYLIKQYLQTSEQEPIYKTMWEESLAGIKKWLITYSEPSMFTVLAERPAGLNQPLEPKVDHLTCFLPGTIALAATGGRSVDEARKDAGWGSKQEEDLRLAGELMKTCWGMYKVTPTGLAGEITHFKISKPPRMFNEFRQGATPKGPDLDNRQVLDRLIARKEFIVKERDAHNLQRPETVESLFYMWRITGDVKYRHWGYEMFRSFVRWSLVDRDSGYSSISSVLETPPKFRDHLESFWMAETLKYFYLLFASPDILPLDQVVFNTEAHPMPRFELGRVFHTWQRGDESAKWKTWPAGNDPKAAKEEEGAGAAAAAAAARKVSPAAPGQGRQTREQYEAAGGVAKDQVSIEEKLKQVLGEVGAAKVKAQAGAGAGAASDDKVAEMKRMMSQEEAEEEEKTIASVGGQEEEEEED